MSTPIKLKIYGERNVGTNYIEMLVVQNLDATVLPGHVPPQNLRTKFTRRLKKVITRADKWHESARDRYFEKHFADNLGWKHMRPSPERIGAENLENVRFVLVVKNPYSWLLSLYRNPYHVGGRDTEFANFLKRQLPVLELRENIGTEKLLPAEVWNIKGHGYLALQKMAKHSILVPYEDFLRDEAVTINRISRALDIDLKPEFTSVTKGVKRNDQNITRADYVDYYLNERWKDDLTPQTIEMINKTLDADLVSALGYELITPSF